MATFLYRDESGGFYTVECDPRLAPEGAIREVPEGFMVRPGMDLDEDGVPFLADLEPSRQAAIEQVRARASEIRRGYVTDLPGQEMIYLRKAEEARRFLDAGEPEDLTGFPFLAAEVGVTAPTAPDLARLWIGMNAAWEAAGAQLEHDRQSANARIRAAASAEEIDEAVADFFAAWAGDAPASVTLEGNHGE